MTEKDLIIKRTFNAPRNKVWDAWVNPELIKCWWGPAKFTAPVIKLDFQVGGKYLFCMRSPEGFDYWSTGEFQEIKPMDRIVYTDSFADENGNSVPANKYGMKGDWPEKLFVTLTFKENGSKKNHLHSKTLGYAG